MFSIVRIEETIDNWPSIYMYGLYILWIQPVMSRKYSRENVASELNTDRLLLSHHSLNGTVEQEHLHCISYCKLSRDDLKNKEGSIQVICKWYAILYKRVEYLPILVSKGSPRTNLPWKTREDYI